MKHLLILCAAFLTSCATKPTTEEGYREFLKFCSERVIDRSIVDAGMRSWTNDIEWGHAMYEMGLYHGCTHGILEWHWFRTEPMKIEDLLKGED